MLNDAQIVRLLDVANAGCHKGMVLESRKIYSNILALRPDHVPALIGMAMSHIVVGEFSEAEEGLRGIIASHPDDADALAVLGLCLFLNDRKDEARDVLAPLADGEGSAAALATDLLAQI